MGTKRGLDGDSPTKPHNLIVRKKLILKREAWGKLPGPLQEAAKRFQAKEIYFFDPPIELPPASPKGIHYRSEYHDYIAYVRRCLKKGERRPGILKSFIQGLKGSGEEGKQLIDQIKSKLLK